MILNPRSPLAFAQGIRSIFPLVAAGAAAIIIGVKIIQRNPSTFGLFGPLGLTTAYGLVGLAASLKSPDGSEALWWAMLYLSVPLVLWGVVWDTHALDHVSRLVNGTWIIVILAAITLFVVAGLYLDLVDRFKNPMQFLECRSTRWLDLTEWKLRETGVGRYAAIAGIIAISGLWQRRWRPICLAVLLTCLPLLLYTGARGSLLGFAAGASLILIIYLMYAGKKALFVGVLVTLILVPILWSTGAPQVFLERCITRGALVLTAPDPAPPKAEVSGSNTLMPDEPTDQAFPPLTIKEFFNFSGRTAIWAEGWHLFKESPLIGFGFHADRLLLGTHMHNSVMHALLQAGLIGAIPFVAAVIFAWVLFFRLVRDLNRMPVAHKHLVIQCGGVLAFLSIRALPESTGAFFGVDWLILAPILFYLQLVKDRHGSR